MKTTDTIPVVILAGGKGARLGDVDKCLLSIAGISILSRILRQFAEHKGSLFLNANGDLSRFDAYPVMKFKDLTDPPIGPIGGLHSTLRHLNNLAQQHSHCLMLPGDCPFLPNDLLEQLANKANSGNFDVVYARANGRDHFVVALWSTLIMTALEDYIASGQRSMHGFISTLNSATVEFGDDDHILFNINTQAQLEQAEAFAQSAIQQQQ